MNGLQESAPGMDSLVRQTELAFQSLEKFLTREYYEAMDIVPDMVQRETPISIYLQAVHGDTEEAAIRISRFWKYRKIFFRDRWLLPMTMNGFGALDELDCEAVKSGVVFIIPRQNTGPLICVDWTKAFEVSNTAISQGVNPVGLGERLLMYVMVANIEALSRGPSTLFHPIVSKRRPAMEIHKRFWECFETAGPCTLGEVVVTHAHQDEGKRELFDFLRYQTVSIVGMATSKVPKQIYSNSTYNTLGLLEKSGIDRGIVPTSIGGNLDHDTSFSQWTEMRLCIESSLAPLPQSLSPATTQATEPCNIMTTFGRPTGRNFNNFQTLVSSNPETGQSEQELQRKRNRMYARRHAERQKFEILLFENQKLDLELQRHVLLRQNEELQRAMTAVKQLLDIAELPCGNPTAIHHNESTPRAPMDLSVSFPVI